MKLLRGPAMSRVLRRFGVDARHYWLLMDLFDTISERGEMLDQLGRNGVALRTAALLYAVLSAFLAVMVVVGHASPGTYLMTFLGFAALLLLSILLSEAGNSLINPSEALVLAHQPVNGATYTAAKLSHLLRIVLWLTPALHGIPAIGSLFLEGARWYQPVVHLAAAFAASLVEALLCCVAFGWLMRFLPARRLKAVGQFAGAVPFVCFMFVGQIQRAVTKVNLRAHLPVTSAGRWALGILTLIAAAAAVLAGMRSLSADYLIRVSAMMRGGTRAGATARRSWTGGIVARFFGAQAGRAGFVFVSQMMLRDWQFRRQALGTCAPLVVAFVSAIAAGWRNADPFEPRFSTLHLVPHTLGILIFIVCTLLPYGSDHKGVWVFLAAPERAIDGFARGIFGMMWIRLVVIPHLAMLAWFAWQWGIGRAALFVLYSAVVATVYVSLGLRSIEAVPFTRQADPTRGATQLPALLLGGMVVAIAVAAQHFLLFRSMLAVGVMGVAGAIAAGWFARASIRAFAADSRFQLGVTSEEAGTLYTEVV